jgi:hypothetical protein
MNIINNYPHNDYENLLDGNESKISIVRYVTTCLTYGCELKSDGFAEYPYYYAITKSDGVYAPFVVEWDESKGHALDYEKNIGKFYQNAMTDQGFFIRIPKERVLKDSVYDIITFRTLSGDAVQIILDYWF